MYFWYVKKTFSSQYLQHDNYNRNKKCFYNEQKY